MRFFLLIQFFLLLFQISHGQKVNVNGNITDQANGQPIDFVTVYIDGSSEVVNSNTQGQYTISVSLNTPTKLIFTRTGYERAERLINVNSNTTLNVALKEAVTNVEITVTAEKGNRENLGQERLEQLKLLPTTTGNLESILPHIALGVSSGTGGELSSQYNVRGGNYDENLVYVNDFEIYRPQLIRAGQQEGLTFANIDLIQSLSFSSGGFEARYGDKLSSVLDIKYKLPTTFKGSLAGSFLGGSAHIEGSTELGNKAQKLRYLLGGRYKTTRYLLGSLDITGEYIPNFSDFQGYLTYDLNSNWQLGLLLNYNRSVYQFRPQERNSAFGLINFALNLFSVFEGQEVDDFTTQMGGLSLTYIPERTSNPFFLKFMASAFQSVENERIDITGRYALQQIETNLGSDGFGRVIGELGSGTQQQFVRNQLNANIGNFEFRGAWELEMDSKKASVEQTHFLQWNAKYQYELIDDRINEWERLDSAGYSLRYDPNEVRLFTVLKSQNNLISNRLSAFIQDTYTFRKDSVGELRFSVGVRANYWDLNQELVVSPRGQLVYTPLRADKDVSFRLAGGFYAQPAFYREMRNLQGVVNTDLRAQKSIHIVGGFDWELNLKRSEKPFQFTAEAYYKKLWDMVSYDIENVRIRYSGQNNAVGYITGIDLRLNGEFVPGAESWFNLSFLRARERLDGVVHEVRKIGDTIGTIVNDVPRPTDQLMTFSVFFQDYLPKNENFKMNLNFTLGTGLPYGIPNNNIRFRNTYRFNPYHRIDIGFAYALWDANKKAVKAGHFMRFTESAWLSLEVFNLMQVQNIASNTWIKTIFEQQFAVPNYLTSRRINLRLRFDF